MTKSINVRSLYEERGEALFKELFLKNRKRFAQWAKKTFHCSEEDAGEAFQEAIVILYTKIDRGQDLVIASSLDTYVFGIGKNLLLKQMKRASRHESTNEIPEIVFDQIKHLEELDEQKMKLHLALNELGSGCRQILNLFYYKEYNIESIKYAMNYKSEEVVRAKKYKCLKQLRTILQTQGSV